MALPKLFQRIFWKNGSTPAINEDNLNAMSKGLSDVDDRVVQLADSILEDVGNATRAEVAAGSAILAAEQAAEYLEETRQAAGAMDFYVDFSTGALMYNNGTTYDFFINQTTGNLEWEVTT